MYRRVAATPTEVMAVYADFAGQSAYMPDMRVSRVVSRPARQSLDVFYEYEVPGPNEKYTVRVTVARTGAGWQAGWTLLGARYARRLSGEVTVEPLSDGALLVYVNRVDPGIFGVTLGNPESVKNRLEATVVALSRHVEKLVAERPGMIVTLVHALQSMAEAH